MKYKSTTVRIRLRKADDKNQWSLCLDCYPVYEGDRIKRVRQSLNRTVTTPILVNNQPQLDKNGIIQCTSQRDQDSCIFAENVRRQVQTEYDRLALMSDEERELARLNDASDGDFIDYMEYITRERHKNSSESIRYNWKRVVSLLKLFTHGEELPLKNLDVKTLNKFKNFLLNAPMGGKKKGIISRNTAATYFSILKAAVHQCFVEGYLPKDVASQLTTIRAKDKMREFLTREELVRLAATPCEDNVLRRACLFSALTGARHSDIMKMKWSEVIEDAGQAKWLFVQKKTKEPLEIYLNAEARALCGERQSAEIRVFDGLAAPSWVSRPLAKWVKSSGIKKHITFHCFRHTFATLQIAGGTDIFTVSKLLGHTNVKTTLIYTKLIDENKIKASNQITLK